MKIMIKTYFLKEVFWCLAHVIENLLPLDYFTSLTGVIIDDLIFQDLFEVHNPDLFTYFKEIDINMSIFVISWFVCIFTSSKINKEVFLNIIDV